MKKLTAFYFAIACLMTIASNAQGINRVPVKMGITQLISETLPEDGQVIVGYHIEERINMRFGGSVTTYKVTNLNQISRVDLGPDNRRIITPIYGRAKKPAVAQVSLAVAPAIGSQSAAFAALKMPETPKMVAIPMVAKAESAKVEEVKTAETSAKEGVTSVKINILHTYERTLERGYKSVEMLKRVGDGRFFEGEYAKAAKWYGQLFGMTNDVEAIYYFRYSKSLEETNQSAKAQEMMKLYNAKK